MPEILYHILYYAFWILQVYLYTMILTLILSWTPLRTSSFYRFLDRLTAPYLDIFRGWFVIGRVDFTPMVGLLLYEFILSMILRAL